LLDALHRTDFEDWIRTDVDASLEKVGDDLGRIGWTFEDVDAALLAGGSSRVPLIQERLRARFGDRLRQTAQLDKVVAKGAALVAAGRYAAEVHDVLARPIGYRVPGQGDQVRRLFNLTMLNFGSVPGLP
jgi:molecular chaperone DnaK